MNLAIGTPMRTTSTVAAALAANVQIMPHASSGLMIRSPGFIANLPQLLGRAPYGLLIRETPASCRKAVGSRRPPVRRRRPPLLGSGITRGLRYCCAKRRLAATPVRPQRPLGMGAGASQRPLVACWDYRDFEAVAESIRGLWLSSCGDVSPELLDHLVGA